MIKLRLKDLQQVYQKSILFYQRKRWFHHRSFPSVPKRSDADPQQYNTLRSAPLEKAFSQLLCIITTL